MKFNNILINGPKEAKNILLLAHGAGAPMDSMFMNAISDIKSIISLLLDLNFHTWQKED